LVALLVILIHGDDPVKSTKPHERPLTGCSGWRGFKCPRAQIVDVFNDQEDNWDDRSDNLPYCVVFSGTLRNTFVNYPRAPNQADGRTVPHAVNGIVVYITQEQQHLLSLINWIMIGSVLIAVVVIADSPGRSI
jgi:hypothetical protein